MLSRQPVHAHLPERTISLQRMGMFLWRRSPKQLLTLMSIGRAILQVNTLLLPFRLPRHRNSSAGISRLQPLVRKIVLQ
jgi:hypothetical protein